jgi:ribA/ribD-fused uncharacterized protein
MRVTPGYTFFYGSNEPFSNWFPARFEEADEVTGSVSFPTSEHHMMYCKAQHFGDTRMAEKIRSAAEPRRAKQLGRQVQGFVAGEWSRVARAYVYRGCRLKFTQNPQIQAALLATGDTQLVEASPTDTLWGVGLSERDERIMDPRAWRGTNWLGEVLTVLRDDLRAARCSLNRLPWGQI